MANEFLTYLLACILAVIIGGYVLRKQIAEPLLGVVEQTAERIATAGNR